MKKINVNPTQADIRKLLSLATLDKNIEHEYGLYMQSPVRELQGCYLKEDVIGCIGIEFSGSKRCEIKHIAVSPSYRGEEIGVK